ncbi:MAG TPA: lysylphosphatidylglycerol synthase domain-containing protein [Gaiellaceae bacterium]|nr:lysylphosphatidylglycerol synthase domain-containing protein [Gaiellaceae bacterium]
MSGLEILRSVGRRGFAAAAGVLLVLGVVAATPQLLGSRVADAVSALGDADPRWLWLAGAGFAVAVLGAAGSWRSATGLCGGRLGMTDAAARYGAGSLVNTFLPARAGDAVRFALFARTLDGSERLLRTGGAFAALGAARAVVLGALVVSGAALGAIPLWPVLAIAGLAAAAAGIAIGVRRREARGRFARLFDAFRTLGREPRAAARLLGWLALSLAARVTAAAAVGAALGIGRPLAAALVIVPMLDVAGLVPVTPGNVGVTSGAVATIFQTHGVSFTHGLAAGIAFHAVETAVGIAFGLGSLVWLAPYPTPATRRIAVLASAASASLAVAGVLSATVLLPLV